MVRALVLLSFALALAAAACGGSSKPSSTPTTVAASVPTAVIAPTPAPSGCSAAEAQQAIDAYKNAQQTLDEFDDARARATGATSDQLSSIITDLQRISRNAGAIVLPACAQNVARSPDRLDHRRDPGADRRADRQAGS